MRNQSPRVADFRPLERLADRLAKELGTSPSELQPLKPEWRAVILAKYCHLAPVLVPVVRRLAAEAIAAELEDGLVTRQLAELHDEAAMLSGNSAVVPGDRGAHA